MKPRKKKRAGPAGDRQITSLVQRMFFAEEVPPEQVEDTIIDYIIHNIKSTPVPEEAI